MPPLCSLVHYYSKYQWSCVYVHTGVTPFAILSVFLGCSVGVHLLFWLAALPACIQLPRSRCQTHYSKSFNLPCIYKCSHLARGPIHCLGSQRNLYPEHQKGSCLVWIGRVCVCVCVYNHVVSNPRYIHFEGRTGVSTVPTSCGASSPRASAAQVTIRSNIKIAGHGLHKEGHINHGWHKYCMICR